MPSHQIRYRGVEYYRVDNVQPVLIRHKGQAYELLSRSAARYIEPHVTAIKEFYPDHDVKGEDIRDLWRFVEDPQPSSNVAVTIDNLFTRVTGLPPEQKHSEYIRLKKVLRGGRFTKRHVKHNPAPVYLLWLLEADAQKLFNTPSEQYMAHWQKINSTVEEYFRRSDVRDMQRQREPERTRKRKTTTTYYGKKLIQWYDEIRKRDPKEYWWQIYHLVGRVLAQEQPGAVDLWRATGTRLVNVFRFPRPEATGERLTIHHRVLPPDPGIRKRLKYRYVYDRVVNPGSIFSALNSQDWDALINRISPNINIPPEVHLEGPELLTYLQHADLSDENLDDASNFLLEVAQNDLLSIKQGFPTFGLPVPGTKRDERYLLKETPGYYPETDEALDEMLKDDPDAVVKEAVPKKRQPRPMQANTVPNFWFGRSRSAVAPLRKRQPELMSLLYDYLDPLADWHVHQPSGDILFMTAALSSSIYTDKMAQHIEYFVQQHPELFGRRARGKVVGTGKIWEALTGEGIVLDVDQYHHDLVVTVRPFRN